MVGIQSAFITIPVNIILVALFKSIKMKESEEQSAEVKPDLENGSGDEDPFGREYTIRIRSLFKQLHDDDDDDDTTDCF